MAPTRKYLAQSNKSPGRGQATKKRRSHTGSAVQFRALAKLVNGQTRYRSALPAIS